MKIIYMLALLPLAACSAPNTADKNAGEKMNNGEVAKIAEAPDGTILWGVTYKSREIFFSSKAGTAFNQREGKVTREVQVP